MAQERKATNYVLSYLNFKIQTDQDDSLTYDDWEILGDEVYILKLLRLRNYHRVFPPMPETDPGKIASKVYVLPQILLPHLNRYVF